MPPYAFFDNGRVSPEGIVQSCRPEVHRRLEGQVAVRQLRLTYLARVAPETPVEQEFTTEEVNVLNGCREKQEKKAGVKVQTIAEAIRAIGRLGGHLGRKGDGLPGAKTLWRGLRRLHDKILGYQMAQKQSNHSHENVRNA